MTVLLIILIKEREFYEFWWKIVKNICCNSDLAPFEFLFLLFFFLSLFYDEFQELVLWWCMLTCYLQYWHTKWVPFQYIIDCSISSLSLCSCTLEGIGKWPRYLGNAIHVGDLDKVLGFSLAQPWQLWWSGEWTIAQKSSLCLFYSAVQISLSK